MPSDGLQPNIQNNHLLSLFSFDVAWFGHLLTGSCTCSGFIKMGIALIMQPAGGWR